MGHDPITLAVFNADADTRMVWAVHRHDSTRIVYVRDDEVDKAYRSWTKATLMCVVPGCAVPLTAAHRTTKRDGFVHQGPVDPHTHRPESVLHQQGKAALLTWVRATYPDVLIDLEVPLEGGVRRPDVYAVSPSGNQIAFEIQYAALSVETWRSRHDWYTDHGITDVWLFGHTGANLTRRGNGVWLNSVQQAAAAAGLPVWWINPVDNTIAWAGSHTNPAGRTDVELLVPATGPYATDVTITPLADARLAADGLRTDEYTKALGARDQLHAFVARPRPPVLEEVTTVESSLERAVWARRPQPIGDDEGHASAWEESHVKARAIELYGPDVWDWLHVPYPEIPPRYVGIDHRHWQAAAFLRAIEHSRSLIDKKWAWIIDTDFAAGVTALNIRHNTVVLNLLLQDWQTVLHKRKVLRFANVKTGGRRERGTVAITPPSARPEPDTGADDQAEIDRQAQALARRARERLDPAPIRPHIPVTRTWRVDPATVPDGHCLGCRGELRDSDVAAGSRRHLGRWACAGPMR